MQGIDTGQQLVACAFVVEAVCTENSAGRWMDEQFVVGVFVQRVGWHVMHFDRGIGLARQTNEHRAGIGHLRGDACPDARHVQGFDRHGKRGVGFVRAGGEQGLGAVAIPVEGPPKPGQRCHEVSDERPQAEHGMPFAGQLAAERARPEPAPSLARTALPAQVQAGHGQHDQGDRRYADDELAGFAGGKALVNLADQAERPLAARPGHRFGRERVEQGAFTPAAGGFRRAVAEQDRVGAVLAPVHAGYGVIGMGAAVTGDEILRQQASTIGFEMLCGFRVEPFQNVLLE